jgi:hypothetical protein
MKAMVLKALCNLKENQMPLELTELPVPIPREQEILLKVSVAGFVIPNWMKLKAALRRHAYR